MAESDIFFSVVIPTCNRDVKLVRAVTSVLQQTFNDYEIIIVNNGDNDLMLPFTDTRIRTVVEKRKGASYARNTGIENAKAEFICFLDDDDEYLENHLEILHQLILKHYKTVALYRTFTRIKYLNGECKDQNVKLMGKDETTLEHLFTVMLVMHCVCCHRNILRNMKFDPSVPVAEDFQLWSRILMKYPLIEAPVITAIYHKSAKSISNPSKSVYLEHIKVYKAIFNNNAIGSQISGKTKRDRIFKYHFWLFCEFKKELTLKEYFETLLKIIYYKPMILFSKELYSVILKNS